MGLPAGLALAIEIGLFQLEKYVWQDSMQAYVSAVPLDPTIVLFLSSFTRKGNDLSFAQLIVAALLFCRMLFPL